MIPKRLQKSIDKLNADLAELAKQTDEEAALLYEDAFTTFRMRNVRVEGDELVYDYNFSDGKGWYEERDSADEDNVRESIQFWRACIRRAKKYWEMDTETLGQIHNGEIEEADRE